MQVAADGSWSPWRWAILLVVFGVAARQAAGILLWPLLGATLWAAVGPAAAALRRRSGDPEHGRKRFARATLLIASIFLALTLTEVVLWGMERAVSGPLPDYSTTPPALLPEPPELPAPLRDKISRMQSALVLPRAWEKHDLEKVPGQQRPYLWHGALHVYDENKMRRRDPFPPKDPARFRILVVGDSFTYGEGIDALWTYPAQIERALARDYDVEVLNLGVRGVASEDIVALVQRFLELEPDLILYGMCLNDFLPSLARQPERFVFPLPRKAKKFLTRRTRIGRLVEQRYDSLLRRLGLRPDFYSELLDHLEGDGYGRRFGRDMAQLNGLVAQAGLPPVVAMVLDQNPRIDGPGHQLARAAEARMRSAGMEVIDSEPFYRRFDGRNLRVSSWEGHPNEEAHAAYAAMFAAALRGRPDLAPFQRTARTGSTARSAN